MRLAGLWFQHTCSVPQLKLIDPSINRQFRAYPRPQHSRPSHGHFRTFLACLTRFSMTPSNASRSPICSSALARQYSSASAASSSSRCSSATCCRSSSSVIPWSASSVVAQRRRAETMSRSGSGGLGRPVDVLGRGDGERPLADAEAEEPGAPLGPQVDDLPGGPCELERLPAAESADSSFLRRETVPRWESVEFLAEPPPPAGPLLRCRDELPVLCWCMLGSTSFFCFLRGSRISSRSTGTPRLTRNRRRIRLRIQSGGCSGGGATSCCQSDAERGVRKTGLSALARVSGGGNDSDAGLSDAGG